MSDSAVTAQKLHEQRVERARRNYEKYKSRKESISEKNRGRDKKLDQLLDEHEIRLQNRLKNTEKDKDNKMAMRRVSYIIFFAVGLLVAIIVMEHLVPGSRLKREKIIDDTPIDEIVPADIAEKALEKDEGEYDSLNNGITEEKMLWNLLMEHFEGNKVAVLGVMCNLKEESKFEASNLEDYNNEMWEIEDNEYTEKVNRKTISEKDFLEARIQDYSNGYYNDYDQWVNLDGGYGYAQYTSYEKKEELYHFAEMWFGPGGEGEGFKFNIGDPKMQAHYIIYLLESDALSDLDAELRRATTVVDACYAWLETYEVPYDPYGDGYYTLAFDRAESAEGIKERCDTE